METCYKYEESCACMCVCFFWGGGEGGLDDGGAWELTWGKLWKSIRREWDFYRFLKFLIGVRIKVKFGTIHGAVILIATVPLFVYIGCG